MKLFVLMTFLPLFSFSQTLNDQIVIGQTRNKDIITMTLDCVANLSDLDTTFFRQNHSLIKFPQSATKDKISFRYIIRQVKKVNSEGLYEVKVLISPVTDNTQLRLKYVENVTYKMIVGTKNQIISWKYFTSEL